MTSLIYGSFVDSHFRQKVAEQMEENNENDDVIHAEEEDGSHDESVPATKRIHRGWYTRLRQTVSHPFNLENCFRSDLNRDEMKNLQSSFSELELTPVLEQIKAGEDFETGLAKYSKGLQRLESMAISHCAFGGKADMQEPLTLLQNGILVKDVTCAICKKQTPPVKPRQSANVSLPRGPTELNTNCASANTCIATNASRT